MSNPEQGGEPLPYYQNQYLEKMAMFGDAANLMLDTYGTRGLNSVGVPIETCSWSDPEIATDYVLARFQQDADIDPLFRGELELRIIEQYPDGEVSERSHAIDPERKLHSSRLIRMTAAQRAEEKEMNRLARELPTDTVVRPPRLDQDVSPEHDMEMRIQVLRRGFDILEASAADEQPK